MESAKSSEAGRALADILLENAEMIGNVRIVVRMLKVGAEELLKLGRELTRRGNVVAVLGSDSEGAKLIVARSNEKSLEGVNCAGVLQSVMPLIEGSGGGKPDYAQGGGSDSGKLEEALEKSKSSILAELRQ
jgi:alanyl-tRNA synthetase